MKISGIYFIALFAVSSIGAFAQYNPTVNVEGDYKPDYIPQERINRFPQRQKFSNIEGRLDFDTNGVITQFTPTAIPMEATGWQSTLPENPYNGYLDLAVGSWLNARLDAGYQFVKTRETAAGVFLNHLSTSLWKPKLSEFTNNVTRQLYDEKVGLYLTHKAAEKGILNMDLYWNTACFNYYGSYFDTERTDVGGIVGTNCPDQVWNDGKFSIGWKSVQEKKFRYNLGATVRYSGFRRIYFQELNWEDYLAKGEYLTGSYMGFKGTRETDLQLEAGFSYTTHDVSTWGLRLSGQGVFQCTGKADYDYYVTGKQPGNYGMVSILPYYQFSKNNFNLEVGPLVNLIFNTEESYPYQVREVLGGYTYFARDKDFYIAPDIRADWHNKSVTAELEIAGGAYLNTLGRNHDMDFYCQPAIFNTSATYSPIDAKLRLSFGPFAGFRIGMYGAYRSVDNFRTGGLYQWFLNNYHLTSYDGHFENGHHLRGFSAGLQLKWNYGDYITISAEGTMQQQSKNTAYFNGYDMPKYTLHSAISTSPIKNLNLGLEYDLRALRYPQIGYQSHEQHTPFRLPNWSNLSFNADYDIKENLNIGITLDNLLCRRQYLLPDLPTPRLTAYLNLSWRF